MAKHPTKNHDEDEFDSTKHREADKAKIQEENKQNEAAAKETAENQEIANFKGLPQAGETREQLLDRIRKMRDEKQPEFKPEAFRPEGLQKAFEAEQKAGQEAVSKAEKEMAQHMAAQKEAAAEKK